MNWIEDHELNGFATRHRGFYLEPKGSASRRKKNLHFVWILHVVFSSCAPPARWHSPLEVLVI